MIHPGKIIYLNGNTGLITSEDKVEDIPESMRFAETASGRVAVVKVIATTAGKQRIIQEYGPKGELLRTTRQIFAD